MTLSAARRQQAEAALEDIERERLGAWNAVLSTWPADDGARASVVSYLGTQVPLLIQRLRNQLDGIYDETGWLRWVDAATELHRSVYDVLGYDQQWTLRNVLLATGAETVQQAGELAKKGLLAELGFVTFAVLGFIAWRVLK